MVWGRKDSHETVTIAYLLDRQVSLGWQEAVAICLEAAEMTERAGKGAVPRYQNIELKPAGRLEFLRGRVQPGDPVSALAMTLNELLPKSRPTQLRLLVSTASPGSGTYKSVGEFIEALKYFERPGRRELLADVYRRALETPVPTGAAADVRPSEADSKTPSKMNPKRRLAVAAVVVLAVGAGAVTLAERGQPGMMTGPVDSVRAMATNWWATAMEATSELRAAAAEDLSMVVERMDEVRTDLTDDLGLDEEADGSTEDVETADVSSSSDTRATSPSLRPAVVDEPDAVEPTSDDSDAALETDDPEVVADGEAVVSTEEVETPLPKPRDLLMATALFDRTDLHVTPPTTVRVQLPAVADQEPWNEQVGVVEAIVSASGAVERVKLISPHSTVHQAMILSAVKTWRFRPALRDGDAVRYRHLIAVAIPRCQTRACS